MNISRKNLLLIAGGIIVIIGGWTLFKHFDPARIKNIDSSGTTIVAFGDSLVQGVGATDGNDLVSDLSRRVGQPIANLGVSGNTTADGLKRLDDVYAQDPKIVMVLLGGNDFLQRVPMDTTFANLDTIITGIQAHGAAVLLLGVRGGLITDVYDGRFSDLAAKDQTGFVSNVLSGLLGDDRYMSDEVHPNDIGYSMIADRVAPVLKSMLEQNRK